ncbi:MAG: hypothetical protein VX438_18080, partial [Planctomycetota bacterium]|nr:hypothetical protein [Planctomycetota bacterium]
RINFHGFAVDPANLIHLASSQLGFSQTKGSQHEFRPTPLGGYSGLLKLTPSTRYKGQFKVEFEVSR